MFESAVTVGLSVSEVVFASSYIEKSITTVLVWICCGKKFGDTRGRSLLFSFFLGGG